MCHKHTHSILSPGLSPQSPPLVPVAFAGSAECHSVIVGSWARWAEHESGWQNCPDSWNLQRGWVGPFAVRLLHLPARSTRAYLTMHLHTSVSLQVWACRSTETEVCTETRRLSKLKGGSEDTRSQLFQYSLITHVITFPVGPLLH